MNKAQMLTAIANATGLKRETIKDLMKNGWVYKLDAQNVPKFEKSR